jgi:hypothetical protein
MNPLEAYLTELRDIRASGAGTKETSYYTPLANLLNEVGKTLKPRVRCIIQLASRGAGIPDGGLFSPQQMKQIDEADPLAELIPEHGVIEAKPASEDAWLTADSKQVSKYWGRYRQVLVTNYRDFLLVGEDNGGQPEKLESYRLAASDKAFWEQAQHPRKLAEAHSDRFIEYLKRVMLHSATLTDPKDVAWFLASYARDAKARIEDKHLPALEGLRKALELDLGMKFEGEKGDHFFRSTLVQTLFYGIFSAWVSWARDANGGARKFDWRTSAFYLQLPVMQELFHIVSEPGSLREETLEEPLGWACSVLNRVDRRRFFERFKEEEAVTYFYEPFLEAFDPELRKQLGVNYTPPEIVRYMVARVDTVLREELKIEDGLADPRVCVLDPCCGTGTFLVEVLRKIDETLSTRVRDGLSSNDLKHIALSRVFGFEILPAPFVVSHLQLGLLLQKLEAPLAADGSERCGVYLTNALTGWEPAQEPKSTLFKKLDEERRQSEKVKQTAQILVVIGNPPYNGFAGVAMAEERGLSEVYRTVKRAPKPQGQGLNDLYVRFYRMAERRIVEKTREGIVCFITNYSWLDRLSHTGMRERYLDVFDSIWIDCLNGDKYRTGKLTPDGKPDPSIFSTEKNREGIQIGTAIGLLARRAEHEPAGKVRFRPLWGTSKRADLALQATQGPAKYDEVRPPLELGLPFMPGQVDVGYLTWPKLPTLLPVSFPGIKTSRDEFLVDIDRERLESRLKVYFDRTVSNDAAKRLLPGAMNSTAGYDAEAVRDRLVKRGRQAKGIVRYCYRPFDVRWLCWESESGLLDRSRPDYIQHVSEGNTWMTSTKGCRKMAFYQPQISEHLCDLNVIEANVQVFPHYICSPRTLVDGDGGQRENVSGSAAAYSAKVGLPVAKLFWHTLATLHAPLYATENVGGLHNDWPRIPLPDKRDLLTASAELGQQVASLLNPEQAVAGVTKGASRPELEVLGNIVGTKSRSLHPSKGDLAVTAGWGHAGKGGVIMPAKGKHSERPYAPDELAAIREGAKALGLREETALAQLGKSTYDICLSDRAYWKNVPSGVWNYHIGGYQVIKKWLSYRESGLLGRDLNPEEARYVTEMVRRIAAILLLQPALDANYRSAKEHAYVWPKPATDVSGGRRPRRHDGT